MPIYEIQKDKIAAIPETRFSDVGLRERDDLQRLLRDQVEIIAPDTLIIAEEFGEWEDSKRRIDLLGIDRNANLVVIELKQTEDGGHMELQAIRYAAMVSTLTWEKVVDVYGRFLKTHGHEDDPVDKLLEFLEWPEPDGDRFAQDISIVLASAEFSKELTTAVLWLNNRDLDIRCVRLRPYRDGNRTLLDVQQVIPLPEAEQYQVQLREKVRSERIARSGSRDYSKFDILAGEKTLGNLAKRNAALEAVRFLIESGISPEAIQEAFPSKGYLFASYEGRLSGEEMGRRRAAERNLTPDAMRRRFYADDDVFHMNGRTYAFTNQWGRDLEDFLSALVGAFPQTKLNYRKSEE